MKYVAFSILISSWLGFTYCAIMGCRKVYLACCGEVGVMKTGFQHIGLAFAIIVLGYILKVTIEYFNEAG